MNFSKLGIGNRYPTLFNLKYSEFCKNCGKCAKNNNQDCYCLEYIPVEYTTQILEKGETYIIDNSVYRENETVKFILPSSSTCAICANTPQNHVEMHSFVFNVLLLYDKNCLECSVYSSSSTV
jgi:hypothetical protein